MEEKSSSKIAVTSAPVSTFIMTGVHGDSAADQIVRGPSGGCRGDLISTPDSGYYRVFYKSFLWGNLRFGGCFEKPSLQALFWSKKFRSWQKIGKVTKRRRSVKPTCANGGTNRANGGTNASFCTSGDFHFSWRVAKSVFTPICHCIATAGYEYVQKIASREIFEGCTQLQPSRSATVGCIAMTKTRAGS